MTKLHYKESPTPAQKSSFKSILAEDEELILVTGLGKAYIRSQFIIYLLFPGAIFLLLGFGIGWLLGFSKIVTLIFGLILLIIGATLKTYHLIAANRYLLTTRRVVIKKGVLSVKLTSAMYDKITHLDVIQSFFDRIFLRHGTIIVNTAGSNKEEIILKFIDYPMEFKNLMERLINREREQFGGRGDTLSAMEGEILS